MFIVSLTILNMTITAHNSWVKEQYCFEQTMVVKFSFSIQCNRTN